MREIKFRAWDLSEDEYISWDRLIRTRYNQDYFRMNNQGNIILSMMTDKHIQLEQFTGLLDKNGKEIYEGDIVRMDNGNEYVKEWQEIEDDDRGGIMAIGFYAYPGIGETIIGNIHENKDLLK